MQNIILHWNLISVPFGPFHNALLTRNSNAKSICKITAIQELWRKFQHKSEKSYFTYYYTVIEITYLKSNQHHVPLNSSSFKSVCRWNMKIFIVVNKKMLSVQCTNCTVQQTEPYIIYLSQYYHMPKYRIINDAEKIRNDTVNPFVGFIFGPLYMKMFYALIINTYTNLWNTM